LHVQRLQNAGLAAGAAAAERNADSASDFHPGVVLADNHITLDPAMPYGFDWNSSFET
jgi:hypothetical protein